jgi:hypothetical protein
MRLDWCWNGLNGGVGVGKHGVGLEGLGVRVQAMMYGSIE